MPLGLLGWATIGLAADPVGPVEVDVDQLSLGSLLDLEVVTASKRLQPLSDAPATIYLVTGEQIRDRGYATLVDLLRDLPGMDPIENYFSEVGTLVPVRGVAGNNKVIVLVNNVRVNPPGGEEMPIRWDITVRNAKQVEIVYGPGSTLYGQDAISAVINIITDQPIDEEAQVGGSLLFAYGNRNLTDSYASVGVLAGRIGGEEVRVSAWAGWRRADLTDLSVAYPAYWAPYQEVVGPKAEPVRSDDGRNGAVRVEAGETAIQVWYRESSRSSSEGSFVPILHFVDEAVWHDSSLVVSANNRARITETVDVVTALTWNRYEVRPDSRYVFPVGGELYLDDYKYALGTSFTGEARVEMRPAETVDVTVGTAASSFDVIPKATVPGGADPGADVVSQAGAFTFYREAGNEDSLVTIPRATNLNYQTLAGYLETALRPLKQLGFVAGVRADVNTRFEQVPISPRLAVLVHPVEAFTAKYVFTRAYVAPAPYFGYNVFDNGVSINRANPDLAPETAMSNELALTLQSHKALVGLSGYLTTQQNLLVVGDRATPLNIVNDEIYIDLAGTQTRTLTQTANGGTSRSTGFDLYGRYSVWNADAWASLSVVDFRSELKDLGGEAAKLDGLSTVNVRAGVTVRPVDQLAITPSLVVRSTPIGLQQPASPVGPLLVDEAQLPYELNAFARYAPTDWFEVFAGGRNVTDHRYALKGIIAPRPAETLQVWGGVKGTL
jgi:outer membrane receptor protein involved in Fe transport